MIILFITMSSQTPSYRLGARVRTFVLLSSEPGATLNSGRTVGKEALFRELVSEVDLADVTRGIEGFVQGLTRSLSRPS